MSEPSAAAMEAAETIDDAAMAAFADVGAPVTDGKRNHRLGSLSTIIDNVLAPERERTRALREAGEGLSLPVPTVDELDHLAIALAAFEKETG